MSMITDSGDEYEYQQDLVLNTFECRFGLSMSHGSSCGGTPSLCSSAILRVKALILGGARSPHSFR